MNITLACRFPRATLTPDQVWSEAKKLCEQLGDAQESFKEWWANPRGPRDPYVALANRDLFVERIKQDDEKLLREFPTVPASGSNGTLLTNASNDKDWAKRGGVALRFDPANGEIRLHIDRVEKVFATPGQVVWSLLEALLRDGRISFAQTNVQQLVNKELLLYSVDRAPFPHREFLGWMGYVPQALTTEQVPNAARLERQGSGTLILSTPLLDLADPAAIKQANHVEMSLVDLDLLPVTDPDLM